MFRALAGGFIGDGTPLDRAISLRPAHLRSVTSTGNDELDRSHARRESFFQIGQRDLESGLLLRIKLDDQAVGHDGLEFPNLQKPFWLQEEVKSVYTPEIRRRGVCRIGDQVFLACRELLEVLGRQQHSFVPVNRCGYVLGSLHVLSTYRFSGTTTSNWFSPNARRNVS